MKLNLGCGKNARDGYEGLDIQDFGQEYVMDIFEFFERTRGKNNIYNEIMANHFLEHFNQDELKIIFSEVGKLLKSKGIFRITVPHQKKESAYALTHKTFWNEEVFRVFENKIFCEEFGCFNYWEVESLVTNSRLDIHCILIKI